MLFIQLAFVFLSLVMMILFGRRWFVLEPLLQHIFKYKVRLITLFQFSHRILSRRLLSNQFQLLNVILMLLDLPFQISSLHLIKKLLLHCLLSLHRIQQLMIL